MTGIQKACKASKNLLDARVSPPSIAQNVDSSKDIVAAETLNDRRPELENVQSTNESQASLKMERNGAVFGNKLPEKYNKFSRFPNFGLDKSLSKNLKP